jgi:hypothetical protein
MTLMVNRRAVAIAALVGLLAVLVASAPVLASTELGHTGTVGTHSLLDTMTNPGAICTYSEKTPSDYYWEGKLTYLSVRPPRVRAIAGSQRVGWRFFVERQTNSSGPWTTTYTSPVQKKTTTTTADAAFTRMGINVNVPTSGHDASPTYLYRVRVRMFWYYPSGSVQGTATHRVDWYKFVQPGFDTYKDHYPCDGWFGWEI